MHYFRIEGGVVLAEVGHLGQGFGVVPHLGQGSPLQKGTQFQTFNI